MIGRVLLCFALAICCAIAANDDADVRSHNKLVVCYMASWAAYRPDDGKFTIDDVNPKLCTHLIYSFAGLNNETHTIQSLDAFLDTEEGGGRGQYKKALALKQKQPKLKVTVALGGWNEGSGKYSDMAMTAEKRRKFIDSVVTFIKKHGFDGLDMDWEYPGSRQGSRVEDRENFVTLLKEMRAEFDKQGWILTAAVGAAPSTINRAYDVQEISKYLNLIHIMAYDYHGSWDSVTGHNAPLRLPVNSSQLSPELRLSVEETVQYYIKKGAPRNKLVLGVPFYGRTFTLVDEALRGTGVASIGLGFQGPYTREDGFFGYNEICRELKDEKSGWAQEWDEVAQTPYMYNGNRWLSFDNERSIGNKAKYAFDEGLAGVMVWAIDNDDFKPECSDIRYPLLRAINREFKKATDSGTVPVTSTPDHTPKPGSLAPSITGGSLVSLICASLIAVILSF